MTQPAIAEEARLSQLRAADPSGSAWVSANAGSGKTRVLIERVARMLLAGARPHRILCLTYTNAAAAEMQNRLFSMLGEWAMASDEALREALQILSGSAAVPSAEELARARRLFAQALETPGGLKIQTIHAFCAAILRRFPMEAGVSPRFDVLDERGRAELMAEARDSAIAQAASDADPVLNAAFRVLTDHFAEEMLVDLFDEALRHRESLASEADIAQVWTALGRQPGEDWREGALRWRDGLDRGAVERAVASLGRGGQTDQGHAERLAAILAAGNGALVFEAASAAFLIGTGEPRKLGKAPTKDIHAAEPWIRPLLEDLQEGFLELQSRVHAMRRAELSAALHAMARQVLRTFTLLKAQRSALDFDDIIARTLALLAHGEAAAWALYKLDGGLDHILVDEAQDTSPDQWRVISALAEEFHAGLGAHDGARTLFVVGDEKQSIYSFQGADPREFERIRARLGGRLEAMGEALERPELLTSFRTASAILRVVDEVLKDPTAAGMSAEELVAHRANRDPGECPGRVDLWPVLPPGEKPEDPPWWEPVDAPGPDDPELLLADALAQEIQRMLVERVTVPGKGRSVKPGDIMILVRRRGKLARELLRRLQQLGVPVAGADRLRIADHIAVKDLLALAKVALLPEDDLSLAALLRSPLFDVSEEQLFDLAYGRGNARLWDRVMKSAAHAQAADMLRDIVAQADYKRPFEFLQHALIRHDGRRRLIGRLGPEAEDAIDELLTQALIYERAETPSLQGFVDWIETGDPEIKREQEPREEGDPGLVRVMTVHGAKGLEAPVVILPDTLAPGRRREPLILTLDGPNGPVAIVGGRAKEDPPQAAAARAEHHRREEEERLRLLYVAMTRAEDWLIVCAAGDPDRAERGWHGLVRRAVADIAQPLDTPLMALGVGPGLRVDDPAATGATAMEQAPGASAAVEPVVSIPNWLVAPLPVEPKTPRPISPSDLGGAHALPGEAAETATAEARAKALRRGDLIHRALELAADAPAQERPALVARILADGTSEVDEVERGAMAAEVLGVLGAPHLAEVFSADALAEPALWAEPPELGGRRIEARLDRLIIRRAPDGAETVRIIDFKTNRQTPARAEDAPEAYLRQLGAYRAAVSQLYPRGRVETAILWTSTAQLMEIPPELTAAALSRAIAEFSES